MSYSPPLVPTEVATSVSRFSTPDTEELLPAMDGTSNMLSLMALLIGGQRNQIAHPGNVTPMLIRPLVGNPATPGFPDPSLTFSPTQTVYVAVEARSFSMEVTEVRQQAARRHQLAIQQLEIATNMSVHETEQRAQQRHEEIVANLQNQIAQSDFQAYAYC